MSSHYPLAYIVAGEKSAVNLGSPYLSLSVFSCCFQDFLFVFIFQHLYLDVDIFEFILYRAFWASWITFFFKSHLRCFSHYFFQHFLPLPLSHASPSGTAVMDMLLHLRVTPDFLSLFVFLCSLSLFVFQMEYFSLSSLIFLFSASSKLLLISSCKFFILGFVIFYSRISFDSFK